MTTITTPISILEFGSTHIRLAIYDENYLSRSYFYEEKIEFTKKLNINENHPVFNLIEKAEKNLGKHLNEISLVLDSPSILSLDFAIKKNYENKKITNQDIDYLINESEQIINKYNKSKEILHTIKSQIITLRFLHKVMII